MFLSSRDLAELVVWRRKLHRAPELSGEEAGTPREICQFLEQTRPDKVIAGLGGHGVAAAYEGAESGPTALFRAELDALPIEEASTFDHPSRAPGNAHLCGHDGHMATLAALARGLANERPKRGRAVLLFQPAEEDGSGAAAVIAPDFCFAFHNMAGLPLGCAALAGRVRLARGENRARGQDRPRLDAGDRRFADGGCRRAHAGADQAHAAGADRWRLRRRAGPRGSLGDAAAVDRRADGAPARRGRSARRAPTSLCQSLTPTSLPIMTFPTT